MYNQLLIFVTYIIAGITIGLLFDFFRILRKCFKTNNIVTYIEDVIFWILVFLILLIISNLFKYIELRFYNFIALLIGASVYYSLLSKIIVKNGTKFLMFFKKKMKDFLMFFKKKMKDFANFCRNIK